MSRRTLIALATLFLATVALAQSQLPERPVTFGFTRGAMHVSFGAQSLANDSVRRALASGLQKNFALTVQVYLRDTTQPVATRQLTCRVVYDLWEESFVIRRGRRTDVVRTVDEAIARCLVADRVVVLDSAGLAPYRGRELFVAVRAEFNPIAGGACARSLRRPGGDDPLGPVVVNIVRREICRAERAIEFRSQRVRVP